jgi:hypothetical protein
MVRLTTGGHPFEGRGRGASRYGERLLPALLLLLALFFPAPPAHAADLVLDEASGYIIEARINGVPLRLKVELEHSGSVTLDPAAAARAGLGNGEGRSIEIIGPVRLEGRFTKARLLIAGRTVRAKVDWQDRPPVSGADGIITPHLLPYDRVILKRRPGAASEQNLVFSSKLHENHGIYVPVRIGGQRVAVRMSVVRPTTSAPTAAAAVIAQTHGGVLGENKSLEEIAFGVKRPARRLLLQRPLRIGGLVIGSLMARTADFRGDHELVRASTPISAGEILVVGKAPSQPPLYRITLGLDVLGRCSSVTYSRGTGELRLRCAGDRGL